MNKRAIVSIIIVFSLLNLIFPVSSLEISNKTVIKQSKSDEDCGDDFYFIQITDTHVMNRVLDGNEEYKKYFCKLIDNINSFEKKPAFIVITGDLVSTGTGIAGSLNYKAFLECVYKKDDQLFADLGYNIPIYTIPGNHDYFFKWNLLNYHRYIDNRHIVRYNILKLLEERQLNDRYTITHENLTLFFLNSGHDCIFTPLNLLYLKGSGLSYWFDIEWLESTLNKCSSKYKIVLMHHPAINWGDHDTIARNQDNFIQLCEGYDVELVLAGHTHASRVYDKNNNFYPNDILPLNCSKYPTLYVQTDACKEGGYYRNITISGNDIWLNPCEKLCYNN